MLLIVIASVLVLILSIASADRALAEAFDIAVVTTVGPGEYVEWELVVTDGQVVTLDISAAGGPVDFYFFDPGDYAKFLASRQGVPGVEITYVAELSQLDSFSIQKSATLADAGVYYFVVVNDNQFAVTLSGSIEGSFVEGEILIAVLIVFSVAGLLILVIMLYIVLIRRGQLPHVAQVPYMTEGRYSPPSVGMSHETVPPRQKLGSMCPNCRMPLPDEPSSCPRCGWTHEETRAG